jgi:hypothetical protein
MKALIHKDASLLPICAKLISQGKLDRKVTGASTTQGKKLQAPRGYYGEQLHPKGFCSF